MKRQRYKNNKKKFLQLVELLQTACYIKSSTWAWASIPKTNPSPQASFSLLNSCFILPWLLMNYTVETTALQLSILQTCESHFCHVETAWKSTSSIINTRKIKDWATSSVVLGQELNCHGGKRYGQVMKLRPVNWTPPLGRLFSALVYR